MKKLEVIFKVAERCNIDCSYCYVFNGADDSYLRHPKIVPGIVFDQVLRFLADGVRELSIDSVQIDLHGGEPLLVGKERFDRMCSEAHRVLGGAATLTLTLQTNAMLIDRGWIELFQRHDIRPSISIDGPQDYHDTHRVDFRGRGTYTRVLRGLMHLKEAYGAQLGALCVIDPERSARRIYRHFVDDLGLRTMDFLLPDHTHDTFAAADAGKYGAFLRELYDEWYGDDDPEIQVRILNSVLSLLVGGRSRVSGFGMETAPAITLGSDGSLAPDDTLRGCGNETFHSGMTVFDTSLVQFLNSPYMAKLEAAHRLLPRACEECCWKAVCGGGLTVNRYSAADAFANPTVFCGDLKLFYAHAAARLVASGHPVESLVARLTSQAPAERIGAVELLV